MISLQRLPKYTLLFTLVLLFVPGIAFAGESNADNCFVMICAALVMLMTPGVAIFYGGMARKKNILSVIMQCFILMGLISVQWVTFGYSLAFGPDHAHLLGGLNWLGLTGVGQSPYSAYSSTIPHLTFMVFQLMFAVITAALIPGAVAERMNFSAFLIFIFLWSTLVYDPLAHWIWGAGGWLRERGFLDFAGGAVVHISAGFSGLIAALVLGKRKGYGNEPMLPHHLPFTVLGAGLLWFGWFGFNAGSALAANGIAASAFVVTNTSAAIATITWVFIEWLHRGKPTMLGAATGCIAGLGAITPASGFVSPASALLIGLVASLICYYAVSVVKTRFAYDDSLDVFGVHGLGGTWGVISVGLFASKLVNPAGANGLFYGNAGQLGIQCLGALATLVFVAAASFVILKIVGVFVKLRVSDQDEDTGLDFSLHGENGYADLAIGETVSYGLPLNAGAENVTLLKELSD